MKISTLILFVGAFFIFTACPGNSSQSAQRRFQENGMDLPDLQSQRYSKVKFQLSDLFDRDYGMDYTIKDNARGFVIYSMDIHFSIERFESNEIEMIQFAFDDEIPAMDAVHDNYVLKREASLNEGETGIKKELPESVNFPGYIQVVEGSTFSYSKQLSYFTATLEIEDDYYVFQMIGKGDNMGHLYDDFIDILSSVKL